MPLTCCYVVARVIAYHSYAVAMVVSVVFNTLMWLLGFSAWLPGPWGNMVDMIYRGMLEEGGHQILIIRKVSKEYAVGFSRFTVRIVTVKTT